MVSAVEAEVAAELAKLHTVLSFAAPSSHLYHAAATSIARVPVGTDLAPRSSLRQPGILGSATATVPGGALLATRRGAMGTTAADALRVPVDAELRAAEADDAARSVARSDLGLAHELMKRDNVKGLIRVAAKTHLETTYREDFRGLPRGTV